MSTSKHRSVVSEQGFALMVALAFIILIAWAAFLMASTR